MPVHLWTADAAREHDSMCRLLKVIADHLEVCRESGYLPNVETLSFWEGACRDSLARAKWTEDEQRRLLENYCARNPIR